MLLNFNKIWYKLTQSILQYLINSSLKDHLSTKLEI